MEKRAEEILKSYEQSIAMIILQCMSELPFDVGPTCLCNILRGSQAKYIREKELDKNSMYNTLCQYKKDRLLAIIRMMKEQRLINSREHAVLGTGEVLSISRYGQKFLDGQTSVDLGIATMPKRPPSYPVSGQTRYKYESDINPESTETQKSSYQERLDRIRAKHPRAYDPWDAEEEQELRDLVGEGMAIKEIARKLQRQPGAITSRIRKLDLNRVTSANTSIPNQNLKPRSIVHKTEISAGSKERQSRIRRRPEDS